MLWVTDERVRDLSPNTTKLALLGPWARLNHIGLTKPQKWEKKMSKEDDFYICFAQFSHLESPAH